MIIPPLSSIDYIEWPTTLGHCKSVTPGPKFAPVGQKRWESCFASPGCYTELYHIQLYLVICSLYTLLFSKIVLSSLQLYITTIDTIYIYLYNSKPVDPTQSSVLCGALAAGGLLYRAAHLRRWLRWSGWERWRERRWVGQPWGEATNISRKSTGNPLEIHWKSTGNPLEIHWKSTGNPLEMGNRKREDVSGWLGTWLLFFHILGIVTPTD